MNREANRTTTTIYKSSQAATPMPNASRTKTQRSTRRSEERAAMLRDTSIEGEAMAHVRSTTGVEENSAPHRANPKTNLYQSPWPECGDETDGATTRNSRAHEVSAQLREAKRAAK